MVVEKDIFFHTMCEHHFLPFYGRAHIAYIPDGRVAGLSKLARTVEVYSKKPQIQERLHIEVADALMDYLGAKGAFVVIEAEHMCMTVSYTHLDVYKRQPLLKANSTRSNAW